jgi:Ca2+-binding EF-hand superfamily protein
MRQRLLAALIALTGATLLAMPAGAAVATPSAGAEADTATHPPRRAMRARVLKRFDLDADGRLDDDERAAVREALQDRRGARRGQGLRGDSPRGERRADRGERPRGQRGQRVFDRVDANGDGVIDHEEWASAAKARRESGRARPGIGRRGQGRGSGLGRGEGRGQGRARGEGRGPARGDAARQPRSERGERGQRLFERLDANGDGVIDLEELRSAGAARRGARPGRPGLQRGSDDAPAIPRRRGRGPVDGRPGPDRPEA